MYVCLSVCLSVGYNRGAHKKAEPIEVQSGSLTRVSQTLRHYVCHRRSMFGRRAFSVADPSAWNSLSDYLQDPLPSFDSFRLDLITFLFSFC